VVVVVIHVDLVAVPLPIAATVEVVRSNYPVGAIVENDIARAVIDGARDEDFLNMFVMAMGIVAPGFHAVVLMVPAAIIGTGFLLFPALVFAVVVPLVVAAMLVPPIVLAIIVVLVAAMIAMLIAVLGRSG
jgi:hypothetical protein